MGLHSINKGTKSFSGGGLPFYLEEDYVFSKINAGYIGGGEWRVPNAKLPTFQIWSIRDNVISFQYKGIRADGTYTGAIFTPPIALITSTAVKKDGVQYYVFSTSDDDNINNPLPDVGRWIIELTIETTLGGATTTYFSEQFVTTECDTTCYSMQFDGVNEYIEASSTTAFDFDIGDAFSFTFWHKNFGGLFSPLATKIGGGKGYRFLNDTGGRLLVQLINSASTYIYVRVTTAPITSLWVHYAVTYSGNGDASGINIYIDGVQQALTIVQNNFPALGTMITAQNFIIGAQLPTLFVGGNSAQVRAWNVELNSADILAEYNISTLNNNIIKQANLIGSPNIKTATFNGLDWDFPDIAGNSTFTSVNMELLDRVEDCP